MIINKIYILILVYEESSATSYDDVSPNSSKVSYTFINSKLKQRESNTPLQKMTFKQSLSLSLNNLKNQKLCLPDSLSFKPNKYIESNKSMEVSYHTKSQNLRSSKEGNNRYSDSYNIITKDIVIIKKIDEGAYGEVKLAMYQGNRVALKIYKKNGKQRQQLIEEFTKEIKALDNLRHPNILFYMGYYYERNPANKQDNFVMVSEYASKGSLYNLLNKKKEELIEEDIIKIISQIVGAMIYTHSKFTCFAVNTILNLFKIE